MLCLPSTKHGKQDFYPLKNWLDGDRLRVGGCFCARQATGQYHRHSPGNDDALSRQVAGTKLVLAGGSLDRLLAELTLVRSEKRKNANAWIRNTIPALPRRCFELLMLHEPPRKFML